MMLKMTVVINTY